MEAILNVMAFICWIWAFYFVYQGRNSIRSHDRQYIEKLLQENLQLSHQLNWHKTQCKCKCLEEEHG